ncbi:MAG: DinB family protein [Treponema sp.]|nr:DinB family protein [Treponema sp.]
MNKETIILFANYNQTANKAMNKIIQTLTPAEWDKNLGGFFKSVHGLCSHLYICDFNWLKRYSKFRDFTVFGDSFFAREMYPFSEVIFDDMNEYLSKRPGLDEWIIRFAAELNDSELEGMLTYTNSSGKDYTWFFGGLIMQSLNHDTFHRGMLSLYLEMLGKENDFGSLRPA